MTRLGIDTGGTFTDAVLLSEDQRLIASAKAPTTRHDLAVGIGEAVGAVLAAAGARPADIRLVGLSTTLATNAIVENQGGRAGLVLIGFEPAALERAGLRAALRDDPVGFIAGGHSVFGEEAAPLDLEALDRFVERTKSSVEAYAVAGLFSVRNPEHERRALERIAAQSPLPVTVSHRLADGLDAPRRALTALFNARLVPIIRNLVAHTTAFLAKIGITAPLMVVRGNGALISAAEALGRPVETVLSGPAASAVGAAFLTGLDSAVIADIGGTTTDVGIIAGGRPAVDPLGARIGEHRMMVEAIRISTIGLGGDSEVAFDEDGPEALIRLGPRRVIPVAALAGAHADMVHRTLDLQLLKPLPGAWDGRFARLVRPEQRPDLPAGEARLLAALQAGPQPLETLLASQLAHGTLLRLVSRGLVAISALTPTDAAHVLGLHTAFDVEAAKKAAQLFLRRRDRLGRLRAPGISALAERILETLRRNSADFVLESVASFDGLPSLNLASQPLVRQALNRQAGLLRARIDLTAPIIGLGASASLHYPAIADRLGAPVVIPEAAGVANAVGAVVGLVRRDISMRITQPERGRFRLHGETEPRDFVDCEAALQAARTAAEALARARVLAEGAESVEVSLEIEVKSADIGGETLVIEIDIRAQATGRPAPHRGGGES